MPLANRIALLFCADRSAACWKATAPSTSPTSQPASSEESDTDTSTQQAAQLRAAYLKPAAQWPKANVDQSVADFQDIGLLPRMRFPADNTYSKLKEDLGKQLFFDPRLSASKALACASCHDPDLAWTDGRTVSFGHDRQAGKRNAPQIMDAGYQKYLFWDGRADSLEAQALRPIEATNEMHADETEVVKRISEQPEYVSEFKEAFGDERIDMTRIAQAIATFERTITAGHSRFDLFISGTNKKALSDAAIRGLNLFRTSARCINCHYGPNFSDGKFHNIGLTYYGRKYEDLGRYTVTKDPADVGRFRTPSLRNISRTGPYMHNGLFELAGVLNIYIAGGAHPPRRAGQENDPLFPVTDPLLHMLKLTQHDKDDLLAFLDALAEPKQRVRPPELPGMAQLDLPVATTRPTSNVSTAN